MGFCRLCIITIVTWYDLVFAEELKKCDSKIHMAFDEKLKLISKLCHIPPEGVADLVVDASPSSDASPDTAGAKKPKDAKELVVACIHQGMSHNDISLEMKFTKLKTFYFVHLIH